MKPLTLTHSEFLALLEIVQAHGMLHAIGEHLFPSRGDELQAFLDLGRASLLERNLVQSDQEDDLTVDADLLAAISTTTNPDISVSVVLDRRDSGLEATILWQSGQHIVEQVFLNEACQQLSTMQGEHLIVERLLQLMPIDAGKGDTSDIATIEMDAGAFFAMKRLAEDGEDETAAQLLRRYGLPDSQVDHLLRAFQQPIFSSTVTFFRFSMGSLDHTDYLGLIRGEEGAWLVNRSAPDRSTLNIKQVESTEVASLLSNCLSVGSRTKASEQAQ